MFVHSRKSGTLSRTKSSRNPKLSFSLVKTNVNDNMIKLSQCRFYRMKMIISIDKIKYKNLYIYTRVRIHHSERTSVISHEKMKRSSVSAWNAILIGLKRHHADRARTRTLFLEAREFQNKRRVSFSFRQARILQFDCIDDSICHRNKGRVRETTRATAAKDSDRCCRWYYPSLCTLDEKL